MAIREGKLFRLLFRTDPHALHLLCMERKSVESDLNLEVNLYFSQLTVLITKCTQAILVSRINVVYCYSTVGVNLDNSDISSGL